MDRRKARPLSQRERRRMRLRQWFFVALAVLVITSWVVSLIRF